MKTIEELEAQLETVTRERDEARAYAEDRNDEANKLQRCLNMAATERDEAREQAKAYNDNAYALSLGVDQLTKERDEARSLLTQARVAVEHERDRLSDCEHDPAFCTCDEAARTSVLLAKIDAMIVDPSEMRRLRILERDEARAEVERLEVACHAWAEDMREAARLCEQAGNEMPIDAVRRFVSSKAAIVDMLQDRLSESRAEVGRLMHQLADATNESTHFQVMCKRETEEVERLTSELQRERLKTFAAQNFSQMLRQEAEQMREYGLSYEGVRKVLRDHDDGEISFGKLMDLIRAAARAMAEDQLSGKTGGLP